MSLALDGSKLDGSCQGKQRGLLLTFLTRRKDNLAGATCSDECALIQAGTIGISTRDRNCMQLPPKSGEQNCWHPTSHASHSHLKVPQITILVAKDQNGLFRNVPIPWHVNALHMKLNGASTCKLHFIASRR